MRSRKRTESWVCMDALITQLIRDVIQHTTNSSTYATKWWMGHQEVSKLNTISEFIYSRQILTLCWSRSLIHKCLLKVKWSNRTWRPSKIVTLNIICRGRWCRLDRARMSSGILQKCVQVKDKTTRIQITFCQVSIQEEFTYMKTISKAILLTMKSLWKV